MQHALGDASYYQTFQTTAPMSRQSEQSISLFGIFTCLNDGMCDIATGDDRCSHRKIEMRCATLFQLLHERGEVCFGRLLFLTNKLYTVVDLAFPLPIGDWKIYDT